MSSDNRNNNAWQYADDPAAAADETNETVQEPAGSADPFLLDSSNLPNIDDEPENSSKTLNRTTLILFGVCIVAVIAIFLVSRGQKPQPASEEEKAKTAALDKALAKLTNQTKSSKSQAIDAGNMVEVFYNYPTSTQVAANELQRNPFLRNEDAPDDVVVVVAKDAGPNLDALQKKLGELKLQSLGGSICLINNNVLTEGDIVNDFTIKKIENNQVVLTADNHDFVLKL